MGSNGGAEKGWVRDGVMDSLSKSPSNLTTLAKELGVTKSTVEYHLRGLLERGLVQISSVETGRGGIMSKTYSLGRGAVVLMPTLAEEKREIRHLEEAYEVESLGWRSSGKPLGGAELRSLLYGLFLHLFNITRSRHRDLLKDYGRRTGEVVSRDFGGRGRTGSLLELVAWMRGNRVASTDLIEEPESQSSLLVMNDCLGATEHPSRSCWFLEGLVEGVVRARLGSAYTESRMEDAGIPSCCLVVTRGKNLDRKRLSAALFSSPMRTAGRRFSEEGQ